MVMFDLLLNICKLGVIVQYIHNSIKQRDLYENALRYLLHILFAYYIWCVFFFSIFLGGGDGGGKALPVIQEHPLIRFIYVLELSRSDNANSNPR